MNMSEDELSALFTSLMSGEEASYSNNLNSFGYADPDVPSQISIYPKDFESKESIIAILDDYPTAEWRRQAMRTRSSPILMWWER